MAEKWIKMIAERNTVSEQLEGLRQKYSEGKPENKAELATKILPLEQKYEKLVSDLCSLEKEIRTFEQR